MLQNFEKRPFTANLRDNKPLTHDVYAKGQGGSVMLIQELPGLESRTETLAHKLISDGFRVHLPHILGPLGKKATAMNTARLFCLRREFRVFARNASSPITDWLSALARDIQTRDGTNRIGVIGMCLTGNFALGLTAVDGVVASVSCQAAMPFAGKSAPHMSPAEIEAARKGMAQGARALAMRYEIDPTSPAARLETFEKLFYPHIETETYPGKGHALLTYDFNQEAYNRTRDFLVERLL